MRQSLACRIRLSSFCDVAKFAVTKGLCRTVEHFDGRGSICDATCNSLQSPRVRLLYFVRELYEAGLLWQG